MQEEDKGISLAQLLKVMFGINKQRRILLGIITAVLFIILALGLKFVYNGSKEVYTSDFNWTVVGLNSGKYIDGSNFDYLSLQTSDILKEVKESNDDFKSIDINSLVEDGNFSIEFIEEKDKDTKEVTKSYYEIKALKKYFSSRNQAKEFIDAVTNYPIKKTISLLEKVNYDSNITAYNNSLIFETQVSYLESQYNLLVSNYDSLVSTYGDVSLNTSRTISQVKQDLTTYFANYSFGSLTSEINNYGLVKDYNEYNDILASNLRSARISYADNLDEQNQLIKQRNELLSNAGSAGFTENPSTTSYDSRIAEITSVNKSLKAAMRDILRKLSKNTLVYADEAALEAAFPEVAKIFTGTSSTTGAFAEIYDTNTQTKDATKFAQKMDLKYRDKLISYTNTLKETQKEVVTNYSTVQYTTGGMIELNGGLSNVMIVIASIAVGFVIGLITNLCLDASHLYDDNKKTISIPESR